MAGGAFFPPNPVVISAAAGVSNVLPKLPGAPLPGVLGLDPNPVAPNAGLAALLLVFPTGVEKPDVVG